MKHFSPNLTLGNYMVIILIFHGEEDFGTENKVQGLLRDI